MIVGGGIAGLFAGLLLARAGKHDIHLIERDERIGGLLRSTELHNGATFDMGIHYAIETGVPEIDSVLFDGLTEEEWHIFPDSLPEGHVFGGRLYRESGCIDARALPDQLYAKGLIELLDGQHAPSDTPNLAEELRAEYGYTYAECIYRPVMRKLTGYELEDLAPGTHRRFHIPRLIALPSRAAKRLKRLPEYDRCIAYEKIADGRSTIRKFYPRNGGIEAWPRSLAQRLVDAGVTIRTGASVDAVVTDDERIVELSLSNGEVLPCDLLIWSVPLPLLARALGLTAAGPPPTFRHVLLLHYLFRAPTVPELHWVSVYDEEFASYRVTLYDNIAPSDRSRGSRVTVEVLQGEMNADIEGISHRVLGELSGLALVDDSSMGDLVAHDWIPNAIPLAQSGAGANGSSSVPISGLSNLVAAGRNTGATFSQAATFEAVMSGIARYVEP